LRRWLPLGSRPGVYGAGLLLVVGAVPLAVMVVARWSTVSGLHAAVGAGLVGGIVLTAAQVLVLPNLAVWGLAWLAGPGFEIADGSAITLAGAHPGLRPAVCAGEGRRRRRWHRRAGHRPRPGPSWGRGDGPGEGAGRRNTPDRAQLRSHPLWDLLRAGQPQGDHGGSRRCVDDRVRP